MAYTYKKLTDVELVNYASEPNLLIEDNGDIKKIPAYNVAIPQVQADWNEEDADSPAFIINKPDLNDVVAGANVIAYTIKSGALYFNGSVATAQSVVDEWDSGAILRINTVSSVGASSGSVVDVSYTLNSGAIDSVTISYHSGADVTSVTL